MLFNIVLFIVLVNLIQFILNPKKRYSALYCGLIGFSGEKPFNKDKVALLFAYNESRGEDSCGIFDGKKVWKALGKATSSFLPFFDRITNPSTLLIGHTRAKTVGAVALDTAHPFRMEDYILAHNGTLEDYATLAREFGIGYNDYKVDSQVVLLSINKTKDFSVLTKFKGAGAFLIADKKNPNKLFIYRNNKRPLFYGTVKTEEGNNIYISSIFNSLSAIGVQHDAIKSFTPEHLYVLEGGKIVKCVLLPNVNSIETKFEKIKLFNFRKNTSVDKAIKEDKDLYDAAVEYKALLEEYNKLLLDDTSIEVEAEVVETKVITLPIVASKVEDKKEDSTNGIFTKVKEFTYDDLHKLNTPNEIFINRKLLESASLVNLRKTEQPIPIIEPPLIDSSEASVQRVLKNIEQGIEESDYSSFDDELVELCGEINKLKVSKQYDVLAEKIDAEKLQQIIDLYDMFYVSKFDTTNFLDVLKMVKSIVLELNTLQDDLVGFQMELKDSNQKVINVTATEIARLQDSVEEALDVVRKFSLIELSEYTI